MSDTSAGPPPSLLDREFYAGDPWPAYAWLRTNAPVWWDDVDGLWGVSRHADVIAASKDPELFCSGQGSRPKTPGNPSMIDSDDPRHNRQRRLVYRGFTPKRVAESEPHVRKLVTEILDEVAHRGECDFTREVAVPLPMILIADMLGVRPEDRDLLQRWSDDLIAGADGPENLTDEVTAAFAEFVGYHREVVAERRRQPGDDLISLLVHADVDGERLTDAELASESLLLLIGGNETTRNVISGGMEALIQHPDQRQLLIDEPGRMTAAAEEFIRWVSPILNMRRTATRDVEQHGQLIREGDELLLMYASANRDEAVFDAPDRFDVTRTPNPHVAFGFGAHFCLGASLARLEVKVVFEELLRRIPDMELAEGAVVSRTPSSFIRGIQSMPVVFTPQD